MTMTQEIKEDARKGSVRRTEESGWGGLPVKCHQLRPQLQTLISKTTVGSSLAFLVFGKEGGARVGQV